MCRGWCAFGPWRTDRASFLLLRIRDAAAASACGLASAPVTNAVHLDKAPPTALHVAFTRDGLEALKLPPTIISGFSDQFSPACGVKKTALTGSAT